MNESGIRPTDRPRRDAARALAAAWLVFMAGLSVGGELEDSGSFVLAGGVGAALVIVGFAAAWRCRAVPPRDHAQRLRLAVWSLALGAVLGVANLAANWMIAQGSPAIRDLLVERMRALDLCHMAANAAHLALQSRVF